MLPYQSTWHRNAFQVLGINPTCRAPLQPPPLRSNMDPRLDISRLLKQERFLLNRLPCPVFDDVHGDVLGSHRDGRVTLEFDDHDCLDAVPRNSLQHQAGRNAFQAGPDLIFLFCSVFLFSCCFSLLFEYSELFLEDCTLCIHDGTPRSLS